MLCLNIPTLSNEPSSRRRFIIVRRSAFNNASIANGCSVHCCMAIFYLNEWQFFTARRIKYAAAYDTLSVGLTDCRAPIGFCIEMDTHYQTIQSPPNSARRDSITFSHQVKDLVKERWQSSNDISIYLVNSIQDRNTSSFITTVGRCCLLVKVIYVAIKFNLW